MIWKNKYKRRKKPWFFNKIQFLNFKKKIQEYSRILLWVSTIIFFYSIVHYNFFSLSENSNSREWNRNQIKKLNLEELYKLKNLDHSNIRIWVLNNSNQTALAAKISDCLLKGYHIGTDWNQGDYNILKQDNYTEKDRHDLGYINQLETKIFVHVDTINNPKFKEDLKEFLLFTGYNNSIINYNYQNKLYEERDITIILGEDWNKTGNLIQCNNTIN